MLFGFPSLPAVCLLAAGLAAQGWVAPPILRAKKDTPGLNPPNIPGTTVEQVHMHQLPGDPPGTWTAVLTVRGLSSAYGGVGGTDLLCGKYDARQDKFTPNLWAKDLNTVDNEFGLMLHHKGFLVAWDVTSGGNMGAWVGQRQTLVSPWKIAGQVQGLPIGQTWLDPSLADYNGVLHILYMNVSDIAMAPLDLTTLKAGAPVTIARAPRSGSKANSPTPIIDP